METWQSVLSDLSETANVEMQQRAIALLTNDDSCNLETLINISDKSFWRNISIVLLNKGYVKNTPILEQLFERLQDINWPGSNNFIKLLGSFPNSIFIPMYKTSINKAIKTRDEEWLDYLALFLYNGKVKKEELCDEVLYKELEKHLAFWK